ncbi:high mobility group box domain-containing protein [Lentinula raphanica]|nr:high mobility group box domain-containing protein [Lentinula raphanica]
MPKETTKAKRKTTEKAEKASRKPKKDPKAPKRALSAYMFFSQDWRERIKSENPDAGFGEVGKLLGAKWKELDEEEKKPYIEQAARDKERAEEEKTAYDVRVQIYGSCINTDYTSSSRTNKRTVLLVAVVVRKQRRTKSNLSLYNPLISYILSTSSLICILVLSFSSTLLT